MPNIEDEFLPALMILELTITNYYQANPQLVDHNVDKVLEGLVRSYTAESKGRSAPTVRFNELESDLHLGLQRACEMLLGRISPSELDELEGIDSESDEIVEGDILEIDVDDSEAENDTLEEEAADPLNTDEIIACLKRLRASMKLWGGSYGRRGYLDYVVQFFGNKGI